MDPLTIIAMASAGLKFAREAIPAIRAAFAAGEISVEQQSTVRAAYDSLRAQAGGEFQGEWWELSGR